jgi:uncharacterized ferritin-like protein (DUF455 family)
MTCQREARVTRVILRNEVTHVILRNEVTHVILRNEVTHVILRNEVTKDLCGWKEILPLPLRVAQGQGQDDTP